jgi:hypothetical protein
VSDNKIFHKVFDVLIKDQILDCNFDNIEWQTIESKFQGIYIPENNHVVHFTQMLNVNGRERSRNTYLSQNFIASNNFALSKSATISVSINPYDLNRPIPIAEFVMVSIRNIASQGATINLSMTTQQAPFQNLEEFLTIRSHLRDKNTGNNSTIIDRNIAVNTITIYGRLDGANGTDTINVCRLVRKLAAQTNEKVQFYNITPSNKYFSPSILQQIQNMYLKIGDVNEDEANIREVLTTRNMFEEQNEDLLSRDQNAFKANIIQKYIAIPNFNIHKCFGCNYKIESNFIGSHIYRYADIRKDFRENKLTIEEAAHLIISCDNGFLLCPNQDKEFEKGMIVFDLNTKSFVANRTRLSKEEFEQVQSNINTSNFKDIQFTKEFINNINEHHKRVNYQQ